MDPFTIAAGIGALGHLFKGITSIFGGNAQNAAMQAAARQASAEAGVNSDLAFEAGNEVAERGAVTAAANGGGLVGSSASVIQDLADRAMFNARVQAYRGVTEVSRDLYEGQVAQRQGLIGGIGEGIAAASSVAGGFMRAAAAKTLLSGRAAALGMAPGMAPGAGSDIFGFNAGGYQSVSAGMGNL